MFQAMFAVLDFIRMRSDYPNAHMRPDCTREEWQWFVEDMTPLILSKWGF